MLSNQTTLPFNSHPTCWIYSVLLGNSHPVCPFWTETGPKWTDEKWMTAVPRSASAIAAESINPGIQGGILGAIQS